MLNLSACQWVMKSGVILNQSAGGVYYTYLQPTLHPAVSFMATGSYVYTAHCLPPCALARRQFISYTQ